jgi:hypothetical protein
MAIPRIRVDELLAFAQARNCLPYAYGGAFSPNVRQSTDCSGLVFSAGAILAGMDPYRRYGSTETFREARRLGILAPTGMMPAASKADVPADAVLKVGVQHGGGGPYSHTACSFFIDGRRYNWESRGDGLRLNQGCDGAWARGWDDSLFSDFWFIPGPVGNPDPNAFPLPSGYYYGPYDGPEQSISGRAGEPRAWTDGLRRWQEHAGVPIDGLYGEATKARAIEYQTRAGLLPDGKIGPRTWALAMEAPMANESEQLFVRLTEWMEAFIGPGLSDIKDVRQQLTGGRDTVYHDDGSINLAASYPGFDFLADGTVPDAVAKIGVALKLPGFLDPKAPR